MAEQKSCEECGALFSCGADDEAGSCWCFELPPIPMDLSKDCLCRPCLQAKIKKLQAE